MPQNPPEPRSFCCCLSRAQPSCPFFVVLLFFSSCDALTILRSWHLQVRMGKSPTGESCGRTPFAAAGHPATQGFGAARSERADLALPTKSHYDKLNLFQRIHRPAAVVIPLLARGICFPDQTGMYVGTLLQIPAPTTKESIAALR